MSDSLERRVEELESQVAYFENLQQQLDEVVVRQDREILQLKQALRDLAEKVSAMREGVVSGSAADEVPPHY